MGNKLLIVSILSTFFLFHSLGTFVDSAPITSCRQTPYPEICKHYLFDTDNLLEPNKQEQTAFNLRDQSILAALNQAIEALQVISNLDLSLFDERAKLAWTDCLELYQDTVDRLNLSLTSTDPIGSQTWLSAAIANQQTCRNGFIDFNLTSHLNSFPPVLTNLTKLLSISLALNKANTVSLPDNTKQDGGRRRKLLGYEFPSWVSASDRKLLQSTAVEPNLVVAKDGSGNFTTISEALAQVNNGSKRFVIYVKRGVYKENVEISKSLKNLMLLGDGIDATIITGNKNAQDGTTTFRTATVAVTGDGFIAKGITFENTAGPEKHQAVALRSGSDRSVFYGCSFKGYQDTLYVHSQQQFYRNCDIYGTVDFIFGDAAVVFQNCNIYVRKPLSFQKNTITAQGRKDLNEDTGIVIHNSVVKAASDLRPVLGSFKSYLGRPWQEYSRTLVMKTFLDELIDGAGWLPWNGDFALSTLYYGEYMNTGTGAATGGRVKWPGFHVINSSEVAEKFTVNKFLVGDSWITAAGVPFDSGL